MDIVLAKTFLEIAETGSFVAAAGRLNVTQTAVSARVHALEEQLGRRLFIRNKSGARLTPAGERFVRHATTLVQVWDRARQQVGLPLGRVDIASVGAEISLWNPVLVEWLVWMKREAPDIALRGEVDTPGRLLEGVQTGSLDMALLYDPPRQASGTVAELLAEEKLVMVTTTPGGDAGAPEDYIHVDWGPAFAASHQAAYPRMVSPGVFISHGPLALRYLLRVGGAGYFRLSAVQPHLLARELWRVPDAPEFSYSVHMVYSSRTETALIDRMRTGFRACLAVPAPASPGDAVAG
ncbi:MAG: LysR family transcriptional regulator [Pelagibacterium sp. SCN 64-44]|nr:MAG: LysR family transcriptional regulator [Pelagibacterium sp. SCN 64-44]